MVHQPGSCCVAGNGANWKGIVASHGAGGLDTLLRRHLPEALQLCMVTAALVELLNFVRLYASLVNSSESIAHCGVAGAA